MPRARRGEWGIRFEISVHQGGYEWVEIPVPTRGQVSFKDVLAPKGVFGSNRPNHRVVGGGVIATETRTDSRGAQLAFMRFGKIAKEVIAATKFDAIETIGDGPNVFLRQGNVVDLAAAAIRNRRLINDFANHYGLLRGGNQRDLMTLAEWETELKTFDDMMVISNAAHRRGDLTTFANRIHQDEQGIFYSGPQLNHEAIARVGDRLEFQDDEGDCVHDLLDDARRYSDRDRARLLFSRLISRRLKGGLSLGVSTLNLERASVVPTNLQSLLYARMWLKTIEWDNSRQFTHCQNLSCGRPLQGRRDQRYCDRVCQNASNNPRRHRSKLEN